MRWVRRLLIVLLLGVLAFYGGGGWYFSDRVEADALQVHQYVPEELTVVKVAPDSITIRDPAPANLPLRSPGVFALQWKGGLGRISGPPKIKGDLVTRTWRADTGQPAPDQIVELNQDDISASALPAGEQMVTYDSPLGAMPARFRPGKGTTWAVLVHGKGAKPAEMERMSRAMRPANLPTLIINYRNDPGVPQDRSGRYGYGVTEWRDLEAAVAYAHKHGANQFVLGGNSMGGAVVASYLKHAKPTDVLGVVLDAPMLDFEQTLEWGAAQQELPMVGKGLPESLTWVAKRISEARFGLRWAPTDYLRDTSWVREPVLIVHGTKDLTVPLSTSRQLARAERRVRLVEFPGAGHCQSWNFDPKAYDETIAAFVKQVT